ncbi:MAG TPA: hypothetical protein VGI33_10965 [Paenibacillus sp.]
MEKRSVRLQAFLWKAASKALGAVVSVRSTAKQSLYERDNMVSIRHLNGHNFSANV